MEDRAGLLAAAQEADRWMIFGSLDIDGEIELLLIAQAFDSTVVFLPPQVADRSWRVAMRELPEGGVEELARSRDETTAVSTSQVIDVVPRPFESWVLSATEQLAEILEAADELNRTEGEVTELTAEGARLRAELEQAEAHSRSWQLQAISQYGELTLYELPEDADIEVERAKRDGQEVLLMGVAGDAKLIALYPPQGLRPWRRSEPGRVEEYGRLMPISEVLDYAGDEHREWVLAQTRRALAEVRAQLRELAPSALGEAASGEQVAEMQALLNLVQIYRQGLEDPLG